jgi:hypothetical protein
MQSWTSSPACSPSASTSSATPCSWTIEALEDQAVAAEPGPCGRPVRPLSPCVPLQPFRLTLSSILATGCFVSKLMRPLVRIWRARQRRRSEPQVGEQLRTCALAVERHILTPASGTAGVSMCRGTRGPRRHQPWPPEFKTCHRVIVSSQPGPAPHHVALQVHHDSH